LEWWSPYRTSGFSPGGTPVSSHNKEPHKSTGLNPGNNKCATEHSGLIVRGFSVYALASKLDCDWQKTVWKLQAGKFTPSASKLTL